jgi:hypothetical protein
MTGCSSVDNYGLVPTEIPSQADTFELKIYLSAPTPTDFIELEQIKNRAANELAFNDIKSFMNAKGFSNYKIIDRRYNTITSNLKYTVHFIRQQSTPPIPINNNIVIPQPQAKTVNNLGDNTAKTTEIISIADDSSYTMPSPVQSTPTHLTPLSHESNNTDAILALSANGQHDYLNWQKMNDPKAFFICDNSHYVWTGGHRRHSMMSADAVQRGYEIATKLNFNNCKLYAINEQVVWNIESNSYTQSASIKNSIDKYNQLRKPAAPPSGFTNVMDINALPNKDQDTVDNYYLYLSQPAPKAFAIGPHGHWGIASNTPDAIRKALSSCDEKAGTQCWLYAVDGQVVWQQDLDRRVTLLKLEQQNPDIAPKTS